MDEQESMKRKKKSRTKKNQGNTESEVLAKKDKSLDPKLIKKWASMLEPVKYVDQNN